MMASGSFATKGELTKQVAHLEITLYKERQIIRLERAANRKMNEKLEQLELANAIFRDKAKELSHDIQANTLTISRFLHEMEEDVPNWAIAEQLGGYISELADVGHKLAHLAHTE